MRHPASTASVPRVCVALQASDCAALRRLQQEVRGADLIELRVDGVVDLDLELLLRECPTPAIVTCRPVWEGGRFCGPESERLAVLTCAANLGAALIDVEWKAEAGALLRARGGRGIILSLHDFDGVPADLEACYESMKDTGAEVLKIAVTPRSFADHRRLEAVAARAAAEAVPFIPVLMGAMGVPARILARRFGAFLTYACPDSPAGMPTGVRSAGRHSPRTTDRTTRPAPSVADVSVDGAYAPTAPGQIPLTRLIEEFRFRAIGPATAVYGLLGRPVLHSPSPAMHNAAFRALGLDAVYVPFEADSVGAFLAGRGTFGVRGFSVTTPFKIDIIPLLDEIDPQARYVGAVNTVDCRGGRLIGFNTDVEGFLAPLRARGDVRGMTAVVLGSGGAARAVAAALTGAGAAVTILARNVARAEALARAYGARWDALDRVAAHPHALLVNATTVGALPDVGATPVPRSSLTADIVYDLVNVPATTRLLREAADAGCDVIGGLEMLVAQGTRQFELWTGRRAPVEVMRTAALAHQS